MSHFVNTNITKIVNKNSKQNAEISKQALQQRLDNIDRTIISQLTIKNKNNRLRKEFHNSIKQIRDNIESQTMKLKEIIEKKSEELKSKLKRLEDNIFKKIDTESAQIYTHISYLNMKKSRLEHFIENGNFTEIIKAELFIPITFREPKLIQIERLIFKMPLMDAESLQAKDLFGSIQNIQINGMIDLLKDETLYEVGFIYEPKLICAMKQDLFMLDFPNIHVYDMHSNNFKSSIDMKITIAKNCTSKDIIGISNFLFILFDMRKTDVNKSIIYKFDLQNYICSEWKTMKLCRISSTNQATILAATCNKELIEFSLDGLQLKLIKYSVESDLTPKSYLNTTYQLIDGRYVATIVDDLTYYEKLCHLYLIDSEGDAIKSNSIKHNGHTTMCTDFDKYIFVGDYNRNIIIVFSTELHKIREFPITKLVEISYDRENKRLLVRTNIEILFVNFNEESFKDI